jgi:hypothetical protein
MAFGGHHTQLLMTQSFLLPRFPVFSARAFDGEEVDN